LAYREFRKRTELPSFGWFDQPKSPGVWGAWEIELVNGTTGYRLPTADEWIRAAKGGTNDRWAGTDKEWRVCRYANVASRGDDGATALPRTERFRCRDKVSGLAEVGQFRPNGFGLYDMSGNVSEWTQTAFGGDSQSWIVVGDNFESGPNLSLRDRPSRNLKSSQKAETIGFRLLRSAAAKVSAP
jgi:formylglycine-generating enzyme required for sulfatase activity